MLNEKDSKNLITKNFFNTGAIISPNPNNRICEVEGCGLGAHAVLFWDFNGSSEALSHGIYCCKKHYGMAKFLADENTEFRIVKDWTKG